MIPTNRLDALTDGVIAIVITLLVLDLRLPDVAGDIDGGTLLPALLGMRHQFASYALSFLVVGVFWISHVQTVRGPDEVDVGQTWLTLGFLGVMTLVPFTTALLSRSHSTLATAIYALAMMFASGLLSMMAARRSPKAELRAWLRHAAMPALFALSIAIALASPGAARLSWLLIPFAAAWGGWRAR